MVAPPIVVVVAVMRADDDDLSLSRARHQRETRGGEGAAQNSAYHSAAIVSIDFFSFLDAPRLSDELGSQTSVFLI